MTVTFKDVQKCGADWQNTSIGCSSVITSLRAIWFYRHSYSKNFFLLHLFLLFLQEFILSEDYNKMTPVKNYQGRNERTVFLPPL